jgi:hypothetical protein
MARLLHDLLFDPPFLTPRVYHMVASFVLPNSIRTDPNYDFAKLDAASLAGKEELAQATREVQEATIAKAAPQGASSPACCPSSTYGENAKFRPRPIATYQAAVIDGHAYSAGDTVLVVGAAPKDSYRDQDATPWFARIIYFYTYDDDADDGQDQEALYAHVRYYTHRGETTLGAVSHARALVDIDSCDQLAAAFIVRPFKISYVYGDALPPDTGFYVDWAWDVERHCFSTIKREDETVDKAAQARLRQSNLADCASCARRLTEFDHLTEERGRRGARSKRKAGSSWVEKPTREEIGSGFTLAGETL